MSSFRLSGLAHEPFAALFDLTDAELARQHIVRMTADTHPGFPCRISLEDAAIGDELLLLPYTHLPEASPYRASGPIFVRRGTARRVLEAGTIPPYVASRSISMRVYDHDHMMIAADTHEGAGIDAPIRQAFADPRAAYIHLHNAKRGCFSCRVDRVD